MKNSQKGFIVPLLLAVIAILVVGSGIYIYSSKKASTVVPVGVNNNVASSTSNWQTYTNNQYGFSFQYPQNMHIDVLKVSSPRAGFFVSEYYIRELNNVRILDVSTTTVKNNDELFANLKNIAVGSNFPVTQKDFYNIGKAVFRGDSIITIHDGYDFSFTDYSNSPDATKISEIMNTFNFTK